MMFIKNLKVVDEGLLFPDFTVEFNLGMETQRLDTKSPIHVHVAKNTPVHVHIKKKKKKLAPRGVPGIPTAVETRLAQGHTSGMKIAASNNKSKSRLKSKSTPPFIPPPGRTSSGKSMSWEGPRHRLEINPPDFPQRKRGPLRMGDLSTSEEDEALGQDNMYETRINTLLDEVGTLRNEGYKSELDTTIRENERLRHSMEKYKNVMEHSRSEVENVENEKEILLKKLVEVEVDGKAAAEEVGKLRDTVRRLKHDKKLTASDVSALAHQREVLMQKLEGFETTNRTLRKLLKQAHLKEGDTNHLAEQRDVLLRKLTEAEARLEEFDMVTEDKDRQLEALMTQVKVDQEQARTLEELQRTMEATRGHLQNQLKNKEGENNRLSVRLREVEQELNRRLVEVEHLEALLSSSREKATKDKEALKKATRVHRDRANKTEEALDSLRNGLASKAEEAEMLAAEVDTYREKFTKTYKERASLEASLIDARGQLQELEKIMYTIDASSPKVSADSLPAKFQTKMLELRTCKAECEQRKEDVVKLTGKLENLEKSSTSKILAAQTEVTKLQTAVNQYETLITEFKAQIDKYRKENDDLTDKLYQKDKEMKRQLNQSNHDNDKVVSRLEKKIAELESYPDLLKTSEIRLEDAQERLRSYEKRSTEHTKLIAELTQKVDTQAEQLERVREKYQDKYDELKQAQMKLDNAERKLEDSKSYRDELANTLNKREDSIHVLQERLDEQRHENTRLTQQVEIALADAKRQAEIQREKALSKERTAQARILDLESQLSRSAATAQQLKKTKDDAERRYNSRLQDMRDRLEQANSSARSMQNYVSFLKSTYTSVFNDTTDSPISSPRLY
eukprot:gene11002-19842_t